MKKQCYKTVNGYVVSSYKCLSIQYFFLSFCSSTALPFDVGLLCSELIAIKKLKNVVHSQSW